MVRRVARYNAVGSWTANRQASEVRPDDPEAEIVNRWAAEAEPGSLDGWKRDAVRRFIPDTLAPVRRPVKLLVLHREGTILKQK